MASSRQILPPESGTMVIGSGDPRGLTRIPHANTDPDPCLGALGSIALETEHCPGVNGWANVRMGTHVRGCSDSRKPPQRISFYGPKHASPWTGEDPDPEIINLDGKSFTPSAICGLARKFADPMPRFIYDVLHELGYAEGDLSHAAGARFLMDLIERRKALYRWAHQS
jgi:hypothetical protein